MKLRNQQEEVDSLKGYSKREISELKDNMHRSYEEQLKRITEMVSSFSSFLHIFATCICVFSHLVYFCHQCVKIRTWVRSALLHS